MKDGWGFGDSLGEGPNIDLTPLIDMVFMLLLFFILSTTFLKPALEVDLPRSSADRAEQTDSKVIVVTIGADGEIFANRENVTRNLNNWMATVEPHTMLDFQVDSAAPFSAFVQVIDEAKKLGHEKFTITTQAFENKGHTP